MPLPIKSDVIVPDTFHSRQAQQYANWLKDAIKALHETVRISRLEATQEMKTEYDKRHIVKDPDIKVGQQVLLKDVRIAPGSNKILTKRPYNQQQYIIKQVVQSHGAGHTYKLTDPKTAKDVRGLITHDRLKHYLTPKRANRERSTIVSRTAATQDGRQNLKAEKNQCRDRISSPV